MLPHVPYLASKNPVHRKYEPLAAILRKKPPKMRLNLFIITILCSMSTFGQTALKHLENAKFKQNKNDYNGALKEFDNAIKIDSTFTEAYILRGICNIKI